VYDKKKTQNLQTQADKRKLPNTIQQLKIFYDYSALEFRFHSLFLTIKYGIVSLTVWRRGL
jgi:hypothetical protein